MVKSIYVASKAYHGPMWIRMREIGYPITCTWIDKYKPNVIEDWTDFWHRCIAEVISSDLLIAYREVGDELKGGFIEIGAALSHNIPIYTVGLDQMSWTRHSLVTNFEDIEEAFKQAVNRHAYTER